MDQFYYLVLGLILLALILAPLWVYLTVKMATFGYLKAKAYMSQLTKEERQS